MFFVRCFSSFLRYIPAHLLHEIRWRFSRFIGLSNPRGCWRFELDEPSVVETWLLYKGAKQKSGQPYIHAVQDIQWIYIYILVESTVGLRVPHLVRSLMRTTSEPSKTCKSVSQDSRLTRQPAAAQVVLWCLAGVGDTGQAPRKEVVRISRAGRLFARRLKLMIRAMKSRNRSLDPQIDNSLQENVGPIIF